MSYFDLALRANKQVINIAEIELGYEISRLDEGGGASTSWTNDATYTNCAFISKTITVGNVPRNIVKVTVNGYDMDPMANLTLCNANNGSWYYSLAEGKLWINPPGGTTAATYLNGAVGSNGVIVVAFFILPFDNAALELGPAGEEVQYEPRIINDDPFSSVVKTKDEYFSEEPQTGGSLTLANHDGYFDALLGAPYVWLQCRVRMANGINYAGYIMPYDSYQEVQTAVISGVERTDQTLRVDFKSNSWRFNVPALQWYYDTDSDPDYPDVVAYTNMDTSKLGTPQPLMFGANDTAASNDINGNWELGIQAVCVDKGIAGGGGGFKSRKYKWLAQLKDPESGNSLTVTVTRVYRKSGANPAILIPSANYSLSEGNTLITFIRGYAISEGDEIRVVGKGYADLTGGAFGGKFTGTSGAQIKMSYDVIHTLAICLAGYQTNELDISSFTDVAKKKRLTYLLLDAAAGSSTVTVNNSAALIVGQELKIGTDDNAGAGYNITAINGRRVSISPNLGTSQTAAADILVFGSLTPPAYDDDIRMFIDTQMNVSELVKSMCVGIRGLVHEGTNGKIRFDLLDALPQAGDIYLTEEDFEYFIDAFTTDRIVSRVVVAYAQSLNQKNPNNETQAADVHNPNVPLRIGARDPAIFKKKKNTRTVTIGGLKFTDNPAEGVYRIQRELTVQTYLTSGNKAKLLADSYYASFKRGARDVRTKELSGIALPVLTGQRAIVYRSRGWGGALNDFVTWTTFGKKDTSASATDLELMQAK